MVQTRRTRKQRTDAAIAYALERRWEQAAQENRSLLDEFADDMEAANRLGKALTELGDLDGAAEAYQRALAMDATNVIARRNLTRLEEMKTQAGKGKRTTSARRPRATATSVETPAASSAAVVRAHSLIEESGKSAEFALQEPNMTALRRVAAGDTAELIAAPRGASVRSTSGAVLGHLEPRAGLRLRRLIEGGNQYAVVIRRITDDSATIYIRETYRAPEQQNEPSFLPPATTAKRRAATRAAIRSSAIVRYESGPDTGDDDFESEDGAWAPRGASASSDDDEMEDAGFGDASLGDDDDAESLGGDDDDEPLADDEDEE